MSRGRHVRSIARIQVLDARPPDQVAEDRRLTIAVCRRSASAPSCCGTAENIAYLYTWRTYCTWLPAPSLLLYKIPGVCSSNDFQLRAAIF
jgi:hypothetical protein